MEYHNSQSESQKRKLFGIMNEECKGCFSIENAQCVMGADEIASECPCATCLVKMVCTVGCDLYKAFDEYWETEYEY